MYIGADQTERMCRLISTFVACIAIRLVFHDVALYMSPFQRIMA